MPSSVDRAAANADTAAVAATVEAIVTAPSLAARIAQIRLVPQRHGTERHAEIYAAVARMLYVPHLVPDFAYIHDEPFFDARYFFRAYRHAARLTEGFTANEASNVAAAIESVPSTLLVFRTLLGLTKDEFAHATKLVAAASGGAALSASRVDALERSALEPKSRRRLVAAPARIAGLTVTRLMARELFDAPEAAGLRLKQHKPDTAGGWRRVARFARDGAPFEVLLHQRHYGGAFRQILDSTSTRRGDMIEDAVEGLFREHGISFIRTGSHNQSEIARRFEVRVAPAPDFVVFDPADDRLVALLECKGSNDGGTARDKALRFGKLRAESVRLGGVPLVAVLAGLGWHRVNDALGPVVRDTDGRVFTLSTLDEMLAISPFASLTRGSPRPKRRRGSTT